MRRALIFLRRIAGIAALAALVLVASLGLLFFRPAWLVNEWSLQKVATMAEHTAGIIIRWERLDIRAAMGDGWSHIFTWDIAGVSVTVPTVPLHFSARDFRGEVTLVWSLASFPDIVRVGQIGPIQMAGGNLQTGPFEATGDDTSSFDINRLALPRILQGAIIKPSTLTFEKYSVATESGVLTGHGTLLAMTEKPKEGGVARRFAEILSLTFVAPAEASGEAPLCWASAGTAWLTGLTNGRPAEHCISSLSLAASVGVSGGYVRVAEVGPAQLTANGLRVSIDPAATPRKELPAQPLGGAAPTQKEADQGRNATGLPPLLEKAVVRNIEIAVRKSAVTVFADGGKWIVSGSVRVKASAQSGTLDDDEAETAVAVDADSLCLSSLVANGCVERARVGVQIAAPDGDLPARIASVTHVQVQSKSIDITSDPSRESTPESRSQNGTSNPPFLTLGDVVFAGKASNFKIKLDRLRLIPIEAGMRRPAVIAASVAARRLPARQGYLPWALETRVSHGKFRSSLDAVVETDDHPFRGQTLRARLNALMQAPTGERLGLTLRGQSRDNGQVAINGTFRANYQGRMDESAISIRGIVDEDHLRLRIAGGLRLPPNLVAVEIPNPIAPPVCQEKPPPNPSVELRAVELRGCTLEATYDQGIPLANVTFLCPLRTAAQVTSVQKRGRNTDLDLNLQLATSIHLQGFAESNDYRDASWRGNAAVQILDQRIMSDHNQARAAGVFTASFLTSQNEPLKNPTWRTDGNLDLRVAAFSWLVAALTETPYAIPAPFNQLEGGTRLWMRLTGDSKSRALRVPFGFETDLASTGQRVKVVTDASLALEGLGSAGELVPTLNARVQLDDIALSLPYISLRQKLPMLLPDPRIDPGNCLVEQPKRDESKLAYRIAIATPPERPVRVKANLAEDDVPVHVRDLVASNAGLQGDVGIGPFDFEVFRRRGTVKEFLVSFAPGRESPEIQGDIEVKYTDITIDVLFAGSADEPTISFVSVPARNEHEIVSALLFGEDVSNLDDDQLQTTDDFSAAVSDRMIGLASLYLLASTPIDSVRYNSATKTVVAKVRLDDKTSLSLGSAAEVNESLGVRRRLTKSWAVATEVSKDKTSGETSASALLEWSRRF